MSAASFLVILVMALATYLTRIGGWLLFRRVSPGPRLSAWLEALPGALFAALVAPMAVEAGAAGWVGAAAAFAAVRLGGPFLLAIAAGLAAFLLARPLLGG